MKPLIPFARIFMHISIVNKIVNAKLKVSKILLSAIPSNDKETVFKAIQIKKKFLNNEELAIVDAIAGLTRGLRLALLAEGVENERQLKVLKSIGCQYGQGYYWSKPLPGNEYEQFYINQIYNIG